MKGVVWEERNEKKTKSTLLRLIVVKSLVSEVSQPSARARTECQPSARARTESQPSARARTERQPSARARTESQPSASIALKF